ncbi:MAG: asparagine synthase (glutamine-hydrolyzing) [Acidobacteriota bacterium]
MCGIAGALGTWPAAQTDAMAARMIAALAHRGPDGGGQQAVAAGPGVSLALAHARLSILDLSDAAAQPMRHDETGSFLIYNGEIYNYRELRVDLERLGHRFRSTGDTEVLLAALVAWGADALPRLNGMYAFAYWDGRGARLLLARDPLGIKPLLLARTTQGLVFASELRGLRRSGVVDSRVSPGAVRAFLTYGAVIEPETALSSVVAVPPGRVITATPDGRIGVPENIWTLDTVLQLHRDPLLATARQQDPEAAVHRALEGAVRRHLVADARLGVLLSGGIDSPLLAALADRAPGHTPEFITVGFEDIPSPDIEFATAIAKHLHGTHTVLTLSGRELSQRIPAAIAAMDQPTVDGINTFVVSSAAAQAGVKVLLSGLGGDELFGGYTTFRRAPLLARFGRFAAAMAPALAVLDRRRRLQWRKVALARRITACRDAYLLQRAIHSGPSHPAMPAAAGPPDDFQLPPETWHRLGAAATWDAFHQIAYLELSFYMCNQLLRDADIFSSAVAVEMRVPYLDLEVVKAAWQLAAGDHVRHGRGKAILRRLLERLVPGVPHRRPKTGFTFPWDAWLRGPLKAMVGDTLLTSRSYETLGLDPRSGFLLFDRFLAVPGAVSWFDVWSLFILVSWRAEQDRYDAG